MGSMGYGPAQPIFDRLRQMGQLGSKAVDSLAHPIRTAESLLGFTPQSPAQDTSWHDKMVKEANEGFRKPDVITMKKPLGK